jgi:hypothetical protein
MSVAVDSDPTGEQVYLLHDYSKLTRYWRVRCQGGAVVEIKEAHREPGESVNGMLDRRTRAGRALTLGFLSLSRHASAPGAPGYAQNLIVLINERVLGDGFATPHLRFRSGFFRRDFTVQAADGWTFRVDYSAPFVRESIRRLVHGDTLEYDPADFIERLVEVVTFNRPEWVMADPRSRSAI